ncbi:helix-turn-helix domain-containing protein [Shimazuella kribbensis]|uniref:helix-turn-helix domain-containing protein n=1 Tax=Shimazuella kribbensis TaxID=139808 RepID=UPI0003F8AA1B|nr:helix-turn-helix transcriptional regulator [Shimazuella kribbensis]
MNVGQRIRKLRKINGLTIKELADKVNVSQPYLSQIERDDKSASVDLLAKVCHVFEISLSEFFNDESELTPELHNWIQAGKKLSSEQRKLLLQTIDGLIEK